MIDTPIEMGWVKVVPLGSWRPGRNHVEISALLPTSEDLACDTSVREQPQKRFLFLNSTEIRVPQFARALRVSTVSRGGLLAACPGSAFTVPGPVSRAAGSAGFSGAALGSGAIGVR